MRWRVARVLPVVGAAVVCLVQRPIVPSHAVMAERSLWDAEVAGAAEVLRPLASDFEKTTALREYLGRRLAIGRLDAAARARLAGVDFASFDPREFYPLFAGQALPADCGLTTFLYIRMLQALGYKAYQYSFGFTDPPFDRFIHSVTLVEIVHAGATRLIVQDPYLNLTFRTPDGAPLDIFGLLGALEAHAYDRIVTDAASVTTSLLVPYPSLYFDHLPPPCRAAMADLLKRSDVAATGRITIERNYQTLMRSPCDNFEGQFEEAMRRHGHTEPFLYAYTLRAAEMVGSEDRGEVQRQIDEVLRRR